MSKYAPLTDSLRSSGRATVPMTFREIESVIGSVLPPSAFTQRAWWSNNPSNNVMTKAWLKAGYKSEKVDMSNHKLEFRKAPPDGEPRRANGNATPADDPRGSFSRAFGALKGTVTIVPGTDLTAPIGEKWDAAR